MRSFLLLLSISLCSSFCYSQIDTTKHTEPSVSPQAQVPIPGVDTPISGPGTLLQSSPQTNVMPLNEPNRKKRKGSTNPPTDPRAFGVGIPIGKTKKDTLR